MINNKQIKHKKIIILKPRLDVPFKNVGEIPKSKGEIIPIRKFYEDFICLIKSKHLKNNDFVKIIEKPLWQFNKEFVLKLNYDEIYIPHHCVNTFDTENSLSNVNYYMQMVFPWLFQVDKLGWCANASVWPIQPNKHKSEVIFKTYQNLLIEGKSKFNQPMRQKLNFEKKFLFFPCQLPHDQTIKLHSDISVSEGLLRTIEIARILKLQLIVKPHPANMASMAPLAKIVSGALQKGYDLLWAYKVNIHDLLENCEAVFTINSGVGMEALLHKKPVFCFGRSEYASVSHFISKEINWQKRNKYISNYPYFFDAYVKNMVDVSMKKN